MTRVLEGERIGRDAEVVVGVVAVLFKDGRALLTRRSDNGKWCFPSGHVEAGESVEEACVRETREEIGVHVTTERLIGVYSSPDRIIEYPGGTRQQPVTLALRVGMQGGTVSTGEETTDWGYYSQEEVGSLDLMEDQIPIIPDAFADHEAAFLR